MLILAFISSDQDLIHIVTQTDCTFCGAACGNVIGGDECVLICSGITEHTGHGLVDMIREVLNNLTQ